MVHENVTTKANEETAVQGMLDETDPVTLKKLNFTVNHYSLRRPEKTFERWERGKSSKTIIDFDIISVVKHFLF